MWPLMGSVCIKGSARPRQKVGHGDRGRRASGPGCHASASLRRKHCPAVADPDLQAAGSTSSLGEGDWTWSCSSCDIKTQSPRRGGSLKRRTIQTRKCISAAWERHPGDTSGSSGLPWLAPYAPFKWVYGTSTRVLPLPTEHRRGLSLFLVTSLRAQALGDGDQNRPRRFPSWQRHSPARGEWDQAACLVRAQSRSVQALKHRLRDKLEAARRRPPGRRPHTRCSPCSPCRRGMITRQSSGIPGVSTQQITFTNQKRLQNGLRA